MTKSNDTEILQQALAACRQELKDRDQHLDLFSHGPLVLISRRNSLGWPIVYVSDNITRFGYDPTQLSAGNAYFADLIHPDDLFTFARRQAHQSGEPCAQAYRLLRRDGSTCPVYDYTQAQRNADGEISHYQSYVLDLSMWPLASSLLAAAEQRFRLLAETSGHLIFSINDKGRCAALFGPWPSLEQDRCALEALGGALPDAFKTRALAGEKVVYIWQDKRLEYEISLQPLSDDKGNINGVLGVGRELSAQRRQEQELKIAQSWKNLLMDKNPAAIFITDRERNIVEINPAFCALFGYEAAQLHGQNSRILHLSDVHWRDFEGRVYAELRQNRAMRLEYPFRHCHGQSLWCDISVHPLSAVDSGALWMLQDLSTVKRLHEELRRADESLKHCVLHDSLTGIFNRAAILEQLEKERQRAARYREPLCIGLFDIDHFKQLNETYGHQAGDEVLRALLARATMVLRGYDLIGRYGGGEFLVVVPRCADARSIFERLRKAVAARPLRTDNGKIAITISIGVANSAAHQHAEDIIRDADKALRQAKNNGRNQVASVCEGREPPTV
jgi:diguanylate cyclase (GGDEF)-like protein/PAS domain S-box-containing protein